MNYKKFYEECVGEKIDGRKYHIHHIDENRENNDIDNLLMLPKRLHLKYHYEKNRMFLQEPLCCLLVTELQPFLDFGLTTNNMVIDNIKRFTDVWSECQKWVDYKAYKMGLMPNIHNIELEDEA